jgi:hypothetical protein
VYIDDITLGNMAVNILKVDSFNDKINYNCIGGLRGPMPDATITAVNQTAQYVSAPSAEELDYNVTTGWDGTYSLIGGGASGSTAQPTDMSSFSQLTMQVKANSASENPVKIKIEIQYGSSGVASVYINGITTAWQKFSITFAFLLPYFPSFDPTQIKQVNIVFESGVATNKIGKLFVDDMQFEK